MPDYADVFFITDRAEKKEKIEGFYKDGGLKNMEIRVGELTAGNGFAMVKGYDYACVIHDNEMDYKDNKIEGRSFSFKCLENILSSKMFVENIITTFENDPRLGMLVPPPPYHSDYYKALGDVEWREHFDDVVSLAKKLDIKIGIDEDKAPVAPLGSMFWFVPSALEKLFHSQAPGLCDVPMKYLFPIITQGAGFYPGRVLSDSFAAVELSNLNHLLAEITKEAFAMHQEGSHFETITKMRTLNTHLHLIFKSKALRISNFLRAFAYKLKAAK
jgi:rhamnosyltransferase